MKVQDNQDLVKRGRSRTALVAIGFAGVLAGASAFAQGFEMTTADPIPGEELIQQVLEASPASPKNWPATLVFRAGGGCTATVVGPQVILTAAHCVEDDGSGTVKLAGAKVGVTCHHHPQYLGDYAADFALCVVEDPLPELPFEKVNTESELLQVATPVQLLGYGCLEEKGVDKSFGVLYKGIAQIVKTQGFYAITRGGAAVCFGDSGGGAYVYTNPAQTRRVLMGVNSRGDISLYSWLSTTSKPAFLDWAETWAEKMGGLAICGLHDAATGCRR